MRAAGALLAAVVAGSLLMSSCTGSSAASFCPIDLDLRTDDAAPVAGQPVRIEITALGCHPETVTATVLAGLRSERSTVDLEQGRGSMAVPPHLTRIAGELTVVANGSAATIDLAPGPPVGAARPWVGPRTIVADGIDQTMAVAAPVDRYGNPVADGTAVGVHRSRAIDGDRQQTSTRGGLAWAVYSSGPTATRAELWSTVGRHEGERVAIHEVPAHAARVELEVPPGPFPVADGRSVIDLQTGILSDSNGNVMPDGVGGQFVVGGPDRTSVLPGVVTAGRLRTAWVVPGTPGTFAVTAMIHGRRSAAASVSLGPAVTQVTATARVVADGVEIDVGPVRQVGGGLVADGTPATVGGVVTTLTAGRAQVVVPAGPERVEVEVLGYRSSVELRP